MNLKNIEISLQLNFIALGLYFIDYLHKIYFDKFILLKNYEIIPFTLDLNLVFYFNRFLSLYVFGFWGYCIIYATLFLIKGYKNEC